MPVPCLVCGQPMVSANAFSLKCLNCGKELNNVSQTLELINKVEEEGAAFTEAKSEAAVWYIMRWKRPGKFAGPFSDKALAEERCKAMNEDVPEGEADFFVTAE